MAAWPGLWAGLRRGARGRPISSSRRPRRSAVENDGDRDSRQPRCRVQRRGTVRAAMLIDAPPAVVFQMMTRCADALQYVPHLRAVPGSRTRRGHELGAGGTRDRFRLVRAARPLRVPRRPRRRPEHHVSPGQRRLQGQRGHLGVRAGRRSARRTLLRYRVYIDPPGYVPNWLARSTFKRELPQMLTDLRRHCEAEQALRAQANAAPN